MSRTHLIILRPMFIIVCLYLQFTVFSQVSPGNISRTNLRVWLKADAGTSSTVHGSDVNSWSDQGDYGNDASTSTAASADLTYGDVFGNDPSYLEDVLNFNPGIDFDDTNSENLEISSGSMFSTASIPDVEMFLIVKVDEIKAGTVLFNFPHDQNDRFAVHLPWSDNNLYWDFGAIGGGNTGRMNFGLGQSVVESRLWSFRSSDTNGVKDVRADGTTTSTTGSLDTFGRGTSFGVSIGSFITHDAGATQQAFIDATVSEIIIYEGNLSDAQRERLETYLAIKYGITLGHDYYSVTYDGSNAASTTLYDVSNGYGNDIAGIGRDDVQGLYQATSKSINDDAIITVTAPTSLDNDDYLIWGNDGNTGSSTGDLPTGYDERLNRVWFFEEVGDVGTVTLRFDLGKLGNRSDDPDDYAVLISNTGAAFSAVTPYTNGATISDNVLTFTNLSISDGDYLTLAVSSIEGPGGVSDDMMLWVRPESVNTEVDGTTLDQWTDQSGLGSNLEPILLDRPLLESGSQVNGNNYLVFTDDNLGQVTLNATSSANSFISVVRASTNGADIFEVDNNSDPRLEITGGAYSANGGAFTSTTTTGEWHIIEMINASATDHRLYVNGASEATNTTNVTISANDTYNMFVDYTGDAAEAIYYSDALSDTERRQVESYLAIKYGITLDISSQDYLKGDGTTILDRTAFVGYDAMITGIGQGNAHSGTNATWLEQYQSKNLNTSAIVTVSNPSDMEDGEYLIWGSDNATAPASLTESSSTISGVTMALDRKWRVTETGETGTVSVSFDLSSVSAVSDRELGRYTLVLDDTEDMSSPISIRKPSSVSDNIVTFDDVDLEDDHFMVLGTNVDAAPGDVTANLELWFKTDAGVTPSSGDVTSWTDQANGLDLDAQNSDPAISVDAMNFNDAIAFDGNDNIYNSGTYDTENLLGGTLTGQHTFYVVAEHSLANPTARNVFFSNGNQFRHGLHTDPRVHIRESSAANNNITPGSLTANQPNIYTIKRATDNSATGGTLYINGGVDATYATDNGVTDDTKITIGGEDDANGDNSWNGTIAEVITFSTSESDANRERIETYLAIKYGITLSHNYVATDGSTTIYDVSTYANDIAGIGRDDSELLAQTQSKSENSDAILTVSSPSDLDSDEYLIWGNDDGALGEATSNLPTGVDEILGRIWRAEETGEVGSITLQFDVSGIADVGTTVEEFALITDTDADFTSGTMITNATSFSSNIVTFSEANLDDGTFFTLATGASSALTEISNTVGNYEVTTDCPVLSGPSFITLRDASGRLVAEINPNGNDLGATCWGVHIGTSGDNSVNTLYEDYLLDRNFYITPTNQPTSEVTVKFYFLNDEISDIRAQLAADSKSYGVDLDEYYQDFFRITKREGSGLSIEVRNLNEKSLVPTVTSYGTTGILAEVSVSEFSEFLAGTDSDDPSSVLPVTLRFFKGDFDHNQVVLTWETASEINNDFFEIQHSTNGRDFDVIGIEDGNGNSSQEIAYRHAHKYPVTGLNFYRLRQVDFDGQYEYSEIIVVDGLVSTENVEFSVYPVPTTQNNINIRVESNRNLGLVRVRIVGLSGKTHVDEFYSFEEQNSVNISPKISMEPGLYLVHIKDRVIKLFITE